MKIINKKKNRKLNSKLFNQNNKVILWRNLFKPKKINSNF